MLVDQVMHFTWCYALCSLNHSEIISALNSFVVDAGAMAHCSLHLYQFWSKNFGRSDCKVDCWSLLQIVRIPFWLSIAEWSCGVHLANGNGNGALLHDGYADASHFSVLGPFQVMTYILCSVEGALTSTVELVHGVKPDYDVLFHLFTTGYFKHAHDGFQACDSIKSK